ncbi:phospholipase D-like domain-containing protein [Paraburkholderia sp. BCC1884]|uniref:phospholipase D-like domain-containing protein n=1 Tax=Paraburkholderia sp. BCC1884 TaxID=2562668 RepID=UPI00118414EB|nr:phosphatidylserine/phosphatidylglycerophosphate/cardiolipin synthase family protein [Paraburkholderia sp. BCC1884]
MTANQLCGHLVPALESGSYPVRPGNRLRALIDSGPAFRRICEAVNAARHSVWLTITFVAPDFPMPDGQGSFLDVLDRAVERGLDVRVLFWRPNPESRGYGQAFAGSPDDMALLRARGSRFLARWDRAHGRFCQHQKTWLIDAGQPSETAFVGGINPTFRLVEPGHAGEGQRHDVYCEVTGPCATDVHHNFVQRWNEASERHRPDGTWAHSGDEPLAFPVAPSAPRGSAVVQIQRNVHAGSYRDRHATPGGVDYDIGAGERSVSDQYVFAIKAARQSIYIENQALPIATIADELEQALKRGVQVVCLVPGEPEIHVHHWRQSSDYAAFFAGIEALGRYESFTLAGIAGRTPSGERSHVYVHAKLMLIDDAWATLGSCNLHANSLNGHSEMNAAVWDADWVRALRCQLLLEHLAEDTGDMDAREALQLYRRIADENTSRWQAGDSNWQGLAFTLDPATYGM